MTTTVTIRKLDDKQRRGKGKRKRRKKTYKNISKAVTKLWTTKEFRQKVCTKEHSEHIRESMLKPETNKKLRCSLHYFYWETYEGYLNRLARSERVRGDKNPAKRPEVRVKLREMHKYFTPMRDSPESKEKMRQTILEGYRNGREPWNKGLTKETDVRVKRVGEAVKKKWLSIHPNERKKRIERFILSGIKAQARLAKSGSIMTGPEREMQDILISLGLREGLDFKYNYPISVRNTTKFADFVLPNYNLVIEVDGLHYHGKTYEKWLRHKKDIDRAFLIAEKGFSVLSISDYEISEFREYVIDEISRTLRIMEVLK